MMAWQQKGNAAEVSATTDEQIKRVEDVIRICEIDTTVWAVDRWLVNKWPVGRKHKQASLTFDKGIVTGSIEDSGEIFIQDLWQIKVWLTRKVEEIRARVVIEEMVEAAKTYMPVQRPIEYPKLESGLLWEIDIPDVHFGRHTWKQESGENYDIHIARDAVQKVTKDLIAFASMFPVTRILLPIGNDWFNVNSKMEETVHGTPQQEDTRWQKTFVRGRELAVWIIDYCSQMAPVDVLIVPGNHDEERSFYMGDALQCWYHASPNVTVDNEARKRKYYPFGKDLIGFTHGYYEKLGSLQNVMAREQPQLWGQSKFREWHTGDKHYKQDLSLDTDESGGMVIRILRALTPADAWLFDKAFIGAQRAAEAFLWHPERGLIGQFTALPT